ncbi:MULTISPECIES: threonine synthase [unclassified Fusibacter]|uniref:threonine synthase n=1 Tax=unclassified Fusibacter TaxID=2624464 RepID=UPI0010108ECC|nr:MULTISPECIES: threonine synthase [unclassified Fusibacter]MCK8061607.1 threonine synthase [Fusibacter sp. A2]NPE23790.1 pyridoxal-phosphate dependent enzyme [Fusibacter sp. A1]RXV58695.1 pyridoxal-phosphate dependent enzyme [Fusibacter sp. A1]
MRTYQCIVCSNEYTVRINRFVCDCGGVLCLTPAKALFDVEKIDSGIWSLFRYHHALPLPSPREWSKLTLGEGMTPLVPVKDHPNVYFKMDYLMPTGSFKDRGAVMLVAKAVELGAKAIVQDSSGNAGASVAAYAARASIPCEIFVPASTSSQKTQQIRAYGAKLTLVDGSREDTARAALQAALEPGVFYASHVYNPYFHEGTKTYVYEVFEQLGGALPDTFIVPVGNGTLLLGIYQGLQDLKDSGLIEMLPRIVAVQSAHCSPIHNRIHKKDQVEAFSPTHAEGIAIADPKRIEQILNALRQTGGTSILAPEDKIIPCKESLSLEGIYVEPTTAATLAAYLSHQYLFSKRETIVIPMCGSGLKK